MTRYRTIVVDPPWHYDRFAGSIGYGGHLSAEDEAAIFDASRWVLNV